MTHPHGTTSHGDDHPAITVTADGPDRISLRGDVDPDLIADGGDIQRWQASMLPACARALAQELTAGRVGTHLYPAWGTYGPLDGQVVQVFEVGVETEHPGIVTVTVTVPTSARPEAIPRYDVACLTADEARGLATRLHALVGYDR